MDTIATTLEAADIATVMELLPHRYPFLLVDRVVDIRSDEYGCGIKNVTINEPHFQGHFPGNPIFPGVLMIEGMAQTAGVIGMLSTETDRPTAVYFLTIDKCKFRKPTGPGDIIHYHMKLVTRRRDMWWFHGDAKVNGEIVAQADVGAMLAD